MLPIQSILNHGPARTRSPFSQQSGSEISSPASDLNEPMIPGLDQQPFPRKKKARDSSDLTYTKPQGPIKYPPFESLDREAFDRTQGFNIYPFGEIGQYCAHIPYSSDKKDVFEKTGRESFHVFVYRFTDPSDGRAYDVMWDYLGGFVRISPFFKSRKHKKTGPAKMLDLNKGLRDVTFHMTGGNRVAQGYWVPYQCARAVCATFCHAIAGALIPIFGPTFPDDCIHPDSGSFGRMVIDPRLIREASHEITAYRHASLSLTKRPAALTSYPRQSYQPMEHTRQRSEHDLRTNTFRGAESHKHRTSDPIQYTQAMSIMPWVDQYGVGYGQNVHDEGHLPSINSDTERDLSNQSNSLFAPPFQPQMDQVYPPLIPQKRPRTEAEPRYRLQHLENQESPKRPRLELEDVQRTVTTLPYNDSQNIVPGLSSSKSLGICFDPRPSTDIPCDPKLRVELPDGRNYDQDELDAAVVLMSINHWCNNQTRVPKPIEPRSRCSSV